jgi:hypothetical protein
MKVITTNREIIYSNACGCSGADGELTSNFSAEEKRAMFQNWYNVNKLDRNVVLEKGVFGAGGLRTDGAKDEKTTNAYKKFGEEFEKMLEDRMKAAPKSNPPPRIKNPFPEKDKPKNKGIGGMLDTMTGLLTKDETNPPVSTTKTPEDEKAAKKKKMIRIALIGGGLIALGAIIIAISKRKK